MGFKEDIRIYTEEAGFLCWTYCNQGHTGLVRNWYSHFTATNPDLHPVVVVLDDVTARELNESGVNTVLFESSIDAPKMAVEFHSGSGWTRIVMVKLEITYEILRHGIACFYTDNDVVILDDLSALLTPQEDCLDIVFQKNHKGSLCSGIYYVHPTDMAKELIGRSFSSGMDSSSLRVVGDQWYLRKHAQQLGDLLRLAYFPRSLVPNGKTWYSRRDCREYTGPVMIHYNCVIGNEKKIEQMSIDGNWRVQAPVLK